MNNPLLSVDQLSCYRGGHLLLSNVCFQLYSGELLQMVGSNGSGKTTLLRILIGLYPSYTGTINPCQDYYQHMYYLGHVLGLKNELTVRENLSLNWRSDIMLDKIHSVLMRFNLIDYQDELCRHLSSGQRQCVALAQLMLSKTRLWILDEPFSSLDRTASELLQQIFLEKLKNGGAILFTSHQPLTLHTLIPKILNLEIDQ